MVRHKNKLREFKFYGYNCIEKASGTYIPFRSHAVHARESLLRVSAGDVGLCMVRIQTRGSSRGRLIRGSGLPRPCWLPGGSTLVRGDEPGGRFAGGTWGFGCALLADKDGCCDYPTAGSEKVSNLLQMFHTSPPLTDVFSGKATTMEGQEQHFHTIFVSGWVKFEESIAHYFSLTNFRCWFCRRLGAGWDNLSVPPFSDHV